MAPIDVLDGYYLSITALITIAYQLLFFAIAYTFQFDKLTDFAGGTNFILLALLTLGLGDGRDHARNLVASLALALWAARLSGFLLFRILRTGADARFDGMRERFWAFLGFWAFQMAWVWTVSLPVTLLNAPRTSGVAPQPAFGAASDIAGLVLYLVGLLMESVSDAQRFRFQQARRQGRVPQDAVCDSGLFAWSRHPNYFGEILIQFCKFLPRAARIPFPPGFSLGWYLGVHAC
jgi:steroid 5-alpha reductase family enzyme